MRPKSIGGGARTAIVVAGALLVAACSTATTQAPAPTPTPSEAQAKDLTGSIGAAAYRIEVPASWNGTLFLYSHGYAAPGGPNPVSAAPGVDATAWLLGHGYAIAGSSYSSTGWALEDAFKDQIALLDLFSSQVGTPKRVIAWGHSLGGIITAGLIQLYPDRFAGAIPMCGVLAGGMATWNTELDGAYVFKTLLAPQSALQLVNVTDPAANLQMALDIFNQAQQTAAGRARLALVAAVGDLPGWFDPTQPEPAPTDYSARIQAQESWESRVDFAFAFKYRAELEKRAGGNPSWNAGVDYSHQLAISADSQDVNAVYRTAGLDLAADLRVLAGAARIKADPQAAAYLDRNLSFDGRLSVPVLSMHTAGDGLVIPQNETAYADVVKAAGKQDLLRQVYVRRAGHCAFTVAETISAVQVMIKRLDTGAWDDASLQPAALNAAALAQGDTYNAFFGSSAPPAFYAFNPGPHPRPFPRGAGVPA
jgi:pimeloyl-ACP methyl ester carboxylesterase